MKTTRTLLFLILSGSLILSSCSTKERDPFISKEESQQIFVVTEVGDITSDKISTLHFFDENQLQEAKSNSEYIGFRLLLMSENLKNLLSKIDGTEAPQLKKGAVAFMIYEGELKVFSVNSSLQSGSKKQMKMTEQLPTDRADINSIILDFKSKKEFSLKELKLQKRISKEHSLAKIQQMITEHNENSSEQKSLEKIGSSEADLKLYLVASFKIDTQGILNKEESDYKERKSSTSR